MIRGVLTLDLAQTLASTEGRALLEFGGSLPAEPLQRISALRKRCGMELAAAVAEQLELRRRAAGRFTSANRMLFTREGLEQSSAEAVANWRAARIPYGARVLDLCAGMGADATALARRGPVLACERNPVAAWCAHHNLIALGLARHATVICADALRLNLHADVLYLDPSRRVDGRRVRSHTLYAPPLEFVNVARRYVNNVVVKVSPALDTGELPFDDARIEVVSLKGECKEAVLWFGEIGPQSKRSASVLPQGFHLACDPAATAPAVAGPSSWLFEPDRAIVRAHLIWEAAALTGTHLMNEQIAYLTGPKPSTAVPGAWYQIAETLPFSMRQIWATLKRLGGRAGVVKVRGVPMEPEALRMQLRELPGREYILVVTRVGNIPTALICLPPASARTEGIEIADF